PKRPLLGNPSGVTPTEGEGFEPPSPCGRQFSRLVQYPFCQPSRSTKSSAVIGLAPPAVLQLDDPNHLRAVCRLVDLLSRGADAISVNSSEGSRTGVLARITRRVRCLFVRPPRSEHAWIGCASTFASRFAASARHRRFVARRSAFSRS